MYDKSEQFFHPFSSILLLGISCQQIINSNLMKEDHKLTFPSNDFFLAYDCVFLVIALITSISRKCSDVILRHPGHSTDHVNIQEV